MDQPIRFLLGFFAIVGAASSLAGAPSLMPTEIKPLTSVVRYAAAHHIALSGFELARNGESDRAGDKLTVLFTIEEGITLRQWLGEFRMVSLTTREAKTKPGTGLGLLGIFQSSLKSDTGHEFSFEQIPVALEIRTHGPFNEEGSAITDLTAVNARILATRDYLEHGLAPMAEIELRLRAAGKKNPGLSLMFSSKYSAEQMAATKARAQEAGFTEDDERHYAEAIYAMVQFGNLGFRTEGMEAITHEIADSPTLFSGAFTNLVWSDMQQENGGNWGLPGRRIFRVPYNFRSRTQARGNFFITASQPPLRNMAGIIGLTVDSTSKNSTKRLVMRVLAGARGGP